MVVQKGQANRKGYKKACKKDMKGTFKEGVSVPVTSAMEALIEEYEEVLSEIKGMTSAN